MTPSTQSERRYRYIVMFEPDRPSRPSEYIREVVIDSPSPEDAVRAALDRLASEPGHGTPDHVRFWQADKLLISVREVSVNLSRNDLTRPSAQKPQPHPTAGELGGGSFASSHGKPILIDAFCGVGGVTKGYQRAGFYVIGVDIERQPNYCGDQFVQADALEFIRDNVLSYAIRPAAVHASPPCPAHSSLTGWGRSRRVAEEPPDLVPATRELLIATGLPYVIENVEGAPLIRPTRICGQGLGLKVRRHRLFETNFPLMGVPCSHDKPIYAVVSGAIGRKQFDPQRKALAPTLEEAKVIMDMPWAVTAREVTNAIPPAYSEHIGHYLMAEITARELAA